MSRDERIKKFWNLMIERESIRQRRLLGLPREDWTTDPIFREYSFTNVKRIHDRTTTLLQREFYGPFAVAHQDDGDLAEHPCTEALLNAAIFRYTGTIEAARKIGWTESWDRERFTGVVADMMTRGYTVFTSAYIVPNAGRTDPKHVVVADVIEAIVENEPRILATESWEIACDRLCECYGVGAFMAKEILLDYILAAGWTPTDWQTWTPVGPGARRGVAYLECGMPKGSLVSESECLATIREIYEQRHVFWPIAMNYPERPGVSPEFPTLDVTDIQFQLCELAKYVKVELGLGRPKRKFRPTVDDITKKE